MYKCQVLLYFDNIYIILFIKKTFFIVNFINKKNINYQFILKFFV